mgnify:CR=1 FL=1|tara:strand:+ start:3182 stop:3352 length:171 start_codon:yes stop_codon:yes gene_type:complete
MEENTNSSSLSDAWKYLKARKAWWLLPLIVLVVLVGGTLVLSTLFPKVIPFLYAVR